MRSRLAATALVALGVFAAIFLLRAVGLLQGLELLVYDQWTRFSAEAPETDSRIVLLEITEQDIRELGHWPLSDLVLAKTLRKLKAVGVRAIGLDIYRDLPVPPGESALRQALENERRIVAVRKFGDSGTDGIPGPPVLQGTDQVGFNDILVDPDGIVRRGLLFLDNGDEAVEYSFALRVALLALAAEGVHPEADPEDPEWMRLGAFTLYPLDGSDGGYAGEDDGGYQFLLDYEGAMGSLESIELSTLLRDEIEPARLRDKIVLLGVNAESLPDFLNVPFEREVGISGVELHGHMVRQLVRQGLGESRPVRFLDDWQEAALIGALALLGCGLAFGARGLSVTVAGLAFVLALLWVAGAYAVRAGWWIPMVAPGLAWIASVGVVEVWSSGRERAQRAMLMRLFSRHVSPEIADEIWRQRGEFFRDGRPRPQRLTASVLFIDIVNYTSRAEKMNPDDHMEWLNDFMETMAQQVQNHGGVVDDYFGDGIKANFGVPFSRDGKDEVARDARAAVSCALAMANALEGLNARYRERHLPSVNTRVGIATGPVLAGSLGSVERLKYTTLGDVVVTAQRLESLDAIDHDFEKLPSRILVGDQTRLHLGERFRCEPLGSFAVKGKDELVGVHRVTEASSRTGSGVD